MINFIKNKVLIFIFILLAWHVLAIFQDPIILPKPFIVFKLVTKLLFIKDTYFSIIYSLMRVFLGIIFIFSFGIPFGICLGISKNIKNIFIPIINIFQRIPIISWILLSLIWFNPSIIPIIILIFNSLPIVLTNIYEGIVNVDKDLIDMSNFYNVSIYKKIKSLYVPSIMSHIISSLSIVFNTSFKIVLMAEIITKNNDGIGNKINIAWLNIETEYILAWTIISIVLTILLDYIKEFLIKKKFGEILC
ncbi:MAG: ABC transporter permease subunit [Fusobacteriaceae bacterium]|nr:ABC transporter permease subunit [Fusobacteriaceae bacterium]